MYDTWAYVRRTVWRDGEEMYHVKQRWQDQWLKWAPELTPSVPGDSGYGWRHWDVYDATNDVYARTSCNRMWTLWYGQDPDPSVD